VHSDDDGQRQALSSSYTLAWARIQESEDQLAAQAAASESDEKLSALYARAATDGEILDDGVVTLLDSLGLDERSVLADLGSGNGGALVRMACALPLRACFGIELIASKHERALALKDAAADDLLAPTALLQGDLIEIGQYAEATAGDGAQENEAKLGDLTHVFTCSVCFDDFLLRRMAQVLADRDTFPRLQVLVSLRSLPTQPLFVEIGTLSLCCTWNAAVRAHVYVLADLLERPLEDQPIAVLERFLCRSGTCSLPAQLQWTDEQVIRLAK